MNRNVVTGIAVLALIVGALSIGVVVKDLWDEANTWGDDDSSMNTVVSFYDEDGSLIDIPLAIMAGGMEVDTMRVKVTWTIQETNIAPDTFYVDIVIKIDLWDWSLNDYVQLASTTHTSTDLISEYEHTWTLATLLPMDQIYKTEGWKLRIYATLRGYAEDLSGAPVESGRSTTDAVYAELTWLDATGTLTIVLYEVKRYIQLPA